MNILYIFPLLLYIATLQYIDYIDILHFQCIVYSLTLPTIPVSTRRTRSLTTWASSCWQQAIIFMAASRFTVGCLAS